MDDANVGRKKGEVREAEIARAILSLVKDVSSFQSTALCFVNDGRLNESERGGRGRLERRKGGEEVREIGSSQGINRKPKIGRSRRKKREYGQVSYFIIEDSRHSAMDNRNK